MARLGYVPYEIGADEMRFLVAATSGHYGRVAVDAGCGLGHFSRRLRRLGYNVTAIDHSSCSLDVARAEGYGPQLRYLDADLEAGVPPGLPRHGVDLVVARTLVPFLSKPVHWLRQVRDLWLAPGGHVYLVVPISEHPLQTGQMTPHEIDVLCEGWQVRRQDHSGVAWIILRPVAH
ncbi:class I SAM-dependent methyltransferase [Streptomyces noursei]|uniref:class I SAM-dependent methyltransferase n=1 Tax=Streptomyces noursei TaxID=1971 RepID=UPI00081C4B95|nr:Methyltransferase domain [Streptomyces noursei ATCC 11455]ANZ21879.1 Methyltransferase domain [Streptomyces noursei ATCC 11455]MCZ0996483.1 class I SAM-dependent methyltransferase [Streptomyces noursei]